MNAYPTTLVEVLCFALQTFCLGFLLGVLVTMLKR